MDDLDGGISKSGKEADKEWNVIAISHTVVKPHTMVIKVIHTTVTLSTVFTANQTVAITMQTEQDTLLVNFKPYLFVLLWPFVVIDHTICRVR